MLGDRPNRKNIREACTLGLFDHKASDCGAVVYRIRVGHGADSCESAGYSGRGAARNRLFVFVTRFAQMHVHVDETRRDNQSGCIKDFNIIRNRITVTE